jgi:hypothetical protein
MDYTKIVTDEYNNPETGLSSAQALYQRLKKQYPDITLKRIKDIMTSNEGYQISQKLVKKFDKRKTIFFYPDELWQMDLVFLDTPQGAPATLNDGVTCLLTAIDCFSKYAWVRPMQNKTGPETAEAMKSIFATGRKPKMLQVDHGSEFHNDDVKKMLSERNIHMYSSNSIHKAAIVERFNRTLKQKMARLFEVTQKFRYIDRLQSLVNNYNSSYHTTIKMTPKEASEKKNEAVVFDNIFSAPIPEKKESKFKVGDWVRIPRTTNIFTKELVGRWSVQIYRIGEVKNTTPVTYKLIEYNGTPVKGAYYDQQLLKIDASKIRELFRIDKVLETKGEGAKKKALVSFIGWGPQYREWLPYDKVEDIVSPLSV